MIISPKIIVITAPIVIGKVASNVSASNDSGTAVNMIDTMIKIIGTYANIVSIVFPPGTLKGLSLSGSVFRSFKKPGKTGI